MVTIIRDSRFAPLTFLKAVASKRWQTEAKNDKYPLKGRGTQTVTGFNPQVLMPADKIFTPLKDSITF